MSAPSEPVGIFGEAEPVGIFGEAEPVGIFGEAETWQHGHADLDGVRLHYVTQGEGPLVILLHGFPEFWYSWRHQIPALAGRFRVVAPDMRGYNDSDKPEGVASYRLDLLTADVMRLIRHFGEEQAIIVGHDWGGAVAWAFAADYPRAVTRLAVLNCPHPTIFRQHLRGNLAQLKRSWYMFFFQLPWLPERAILKDPLDFARRAFRGMAIRKEAFPDEDLLRLAAAIAVPGAATAALNYYRAAARQMASGRPFGPIQCPTLLIWGEADTALGKELTYGMDSLFAGEFTVRYIPNCSHWVQQEQPELVNRYLLEFLGPG